MLHSPWGHGTHMDDARQEADEEGLPTGVESGEDTMAQGGEKVRDIDDCYCDECGGKMRRGSGHARCKTCRDEGDTTDGYDWRWWLWDEE